MNNIFSTVDKSRFSFEALDNGFVLRAIGTDLNGDWESKSFVYLKEEDLYKAISELVAIPDEK